MLIPHAPRAPPVAGLWLYQPTPGVQKTYGIRLTHVVTECIAPPHPSLSDVTGGKES